MSARALGQFAAPTAAEIHDELETLLALARSRHVEFHGFIADVAAFDRQLSGAEVQVIYGARNG